MLELADERTVVTTELTEAESDRFAALVAEHAQLVFAISMSILRNRADAEDSSQECFLRIARYRYRLAFALDKRAFVARIAQRCALDHRKRYVHESPLEDVHASDSAVEASVIADDEIVRLAAAIRTLPDELRAVMDLAQSGELNSKEIGRVLNIPAGTVRTRMMRAKDMLRQKLERGRP